MLIIKSPTLTFKKSSRKSKKALGILKIPWESKALPSTPNFDKNPHQDQKACLDLNLRKGSPSPSFWNCHRYHKSRLLIKSINTILISTPQSKSKNPHFPLQHLLIYDHDQRLGFFLSLLKNPLRPILNLNTITIFNQDQKLSISVYGWGTPLPFNHQQRHLIP